MVRYLSDAIPHLDNESLQTLSVALPAGIAYESLHEAVKERLGAPRSAPVAMDVDGPAPSSRRDHIVSGLRAILAGKNETDIEDVADVVDSDLAAHVLWILYQGFPEYACLSQSLCGFAETGTFSSIDNLTTEAQTETLKALVDLPCLVLGCAKSECHRWSGADGVSMLSVYVPLLRRFPDDDSAQPSVRKLLYKALASAVRHNALGGVAEGPLPMDESIIIALSNKNRSVRLAAG